MLRGSWISGPTLKPDVSLERLGALTRLDERMGFNHSMHAENGAVIDILVKKALRERKTEP